MEEGAVADTEQAKERVQGAAQQAKGRLSEQADQRSTQAGRQAGSMADDIRSVAQELRTQGKDTPARYAEQAADRVQSAGRWLENSDGDQLLRDVEDFARRNPWAVAAGGLALGLAASRMLKASSSKRYSASESNGSSAYRESLASEPMPSGAATAGSRFEREEASFGGSELGRQEGSMVSTEPRS
jgi:hypothetical protein